MTTGICIYGLPGSGKSTFVDVAEEYGLQAVVMGDVVREKAHEAIADPVTGQKIGEWATKQREKHGKAVMAKYTAKHIADTDNEFVIIEGVRSQAELDVFRDSMPINQVFIECPFEKRLQRLKNRNNTDRANLSEDGVTREELEKRDAREKEWGMDELMTNADQTDVTVIPNTGTLNEYETQIETYLDTMLNTN